MRDNVGLPAVPMPMPMDEAVRRLKAEIIAPDWRLTGYRLALLEAALGSLRDALAARRDAVPWSPWPRMSSFISSAIRP